MSGDILVPRNPMDRGSDFATKYDVRAMIREEIVAVLGPTAKLTTEMCDRIGAIEDTLGIVAPDQNAFSRPQGASVATVSRDSGDAD